MSTEDRASGPMPLYGRLLRLRRLRVGGLGSFVFLECTIAVGVLLALAELVSWWAVPVLPVLVASVVKINDMVGAPRPLTDEPVGAARLAGATRQGAGGRRGRGDAVGDDGFADLRFDDYRHDDYRHDDYRHDDYRHDDYRHDGDDDDYAQGGGGRYDRLADLAEVETVRRGVVTRAAGVPAARAAAGAGARRGVRGQVLSGGPVDRDPEPVAEPTYAGRREDTDAGIPVAEPEPVVTAGQQPTTRAHVIGAAVRRSMAVQSQYGRPPATQRSGRHARQEAGAGRRSGTNERGFGRLA